MSSYLDLSKPLNASLPRQQISLSDKLKDKDKYGISDWMKNNMDSLEALGRYQFLRNLDLRDNYRIVSTEFDISHYLRKNDEYDLLSTISQEFDVPYHLKHYDIIGKAVMMLTGEFLKRPDIFTVRCYDADATNEKLRVKTELLHTYIQEQINVEITKKLQEQGIDVDKKDFESEEEAQKYKEDIQAKYQELTPTAIEKYMRFDYRTTAESWGQAVLSKDRIRFNFREQEQVEFRDMLIADRCFTHMYITPVGYALENWNPVNTFFHQAPEIKHVEKGDYVGRVFYMNKSQVIDRFGWRMSENQMGMLYSKDKTISSGSVFGEAFSATMMPFPGYRDMANVTTSLGVDPWSNSPVGNLPTLGFEDLNTGFPNFQFATGDLVQVTEGYWRSQMKIGYLNMTDPETGEEVSTIVDETFKPSLYGIKEIKDTAYVNYEESPEPNSIVWTWTTQIWQGIKINANFSQSVEDRDRNAIYFDVKPCPFQFKGDFNQYNAKLPVCGGVFNNRNAKSNSLVDLLKPYQIAYNAFMNLAYGIAQRNNGRMALIDIRMLSNYKDWGEDTLEKTMVIGRELGVIPLDTSPSNTGGSLQFNQMSVLDLDETDKVMKLMQLASLWEDQGMKQIGISPQRQGSIQASESATGVQAAVNNSYAVTEPYFENFYNYKKRKLTMLLDMAQYVASTTKGDITLSYTTDDMGEAFIKTTGTEVMLSDMSVYIDNAQETLQELERVRALAQNNTTALPMSKLIAITSLKTTNAILKAVEEGEEEMKKQQQQQQAHEKEMQDAQIKSQQEAQDKMLKNENDNKQLDRQNKIQTAQIQAMGFDTDTQGNNVIDSVAQAKIDLDRSKLEHDKTFGFNQSLQQTLSNVNKDKQENRKIDLQEKQINLQQRLLDEKTKTEKIKNEGIKEQNKGQLQLSNDKHAADMKLLNKQAQMKDQEAKHQKEQSKIKLDITKIQLKNAKLPPKRG